MTAVQGKKWVFLGFMSIEGQHRVPLGNLINQKQANKEYEFVKIRLRWRQEMIQSAANLNL